jgi:hypothetical protein
MKIINFKDDNDLEIIINFDNFTYTKGFRDSENWQYWLVYFKNDGPLRLSWKEFGKFEKALQALIENE